MTAGSVAALVDDLGVLCWLLKDAGWVVLCPLVSIPAAMAAIALETRYMMVKWSSQGIPEQMHTLAVVLWLLGNSVWMCGELLFEPSNAPGRRFPWFGGPYLYPDESISRAAVATAQFLFLAGIAALLRCYVKYAVDVSQEGGVSAVPEVGDAAEGDGKVFGIIEPNVYEMVFIGPWILKDYCWSVESLLGAFFFSLVTMALILDSTRRSKDPKGGAELLWVLGNTVWVMAELGWQDMRVEIRMAACGVLLLGCAPLCYVLWSTARGSRLGEEPNEGTRLIAQGQKGQNSSQ